MGLAIVAIPEEQDRVWKISSEKVPHLTLLFLGDEASADTQQIVQFVQHAVDLSEHGQFYLDVDRRGELGEDNADVLFFSKRSWNLKWIKQFRGQLLQNDAIRTAYDSAEQFTAPQDWVPHLTLGYPESPAKPQDPDNDYPLYSVAFDRIAVWTGDYDGPEFRLEWPERDEFDGPLGVAWADTQKAAIQHYGTLEAAIEHYGTKGMKWGVRKEKVAGAARSAGSAVKSGAKAFGRGAKRAAEAVDNHFYEQSIYSTARHEAIHNQVGREMATKAYQLGNSPKYRGKSLRENKELKAEYHQDVAKVTNSAYRRAVKDHIGSNTKGDKTARYVEDARGQRIEIRSTVTQKKVRETPLKSQSQIARERADQMIEELLTPRGARHAATDTEPEEVPDITIPLKIDDNGQIKEVGLVQTEEEPLEQTALKGADFVESLIHGTPEDGEAFVLEHYGVKGMRWGHRNLAGGVTGKMAVGGSKNSAGSGTIRAKAMQAKADQHRQKARVFEKAAEKARPTRAHALRAKAEAHHKKADSFEKAAKSGHKPEPEAVATSATSKVPQGDRRKTQVKAEGGQNHPAHEDAIRVAEAKVKLKKSGPAALSNRELQDVANRVQLEERVSMLTSSRGKKFVRRQLQNESENLARAGVRTGVKKGAKKVGAVGVAAVI